MSSRTLSLLLILVLLAVAGCSKKENPAEQHLQQARAARQAKDLATAEQQYQAVLKDFPTSDAAQAARTELKALDQERLDAAANLGKLLGRITSVLDGYRGFSGHYPQQLEDLNQGGYFFDLDYLTKMVPPHYKAFIFLGGKQDPYRVWLIDHAYRLAMEQTPDQSPHQLPVADVDALENRYQARPLSGNLIALAPRAVAQEK